MLAKTWPKFTLFIFMFSKLANVFLSWRSAKSLGTHLSLEIEFISFNFCSPRWISLAHKRLLNSLSARLSKSPISIFQSIIISTNFSNTFPPLSEAATSKSWSWKYGNIVTLFGNLFFISSYFLVLIAIQTWDEVDILITIQRS